jgi:hypothetical protein
LRSQYLLSYSPANKKPGTKLRKVKIEIVNPELNEQELQLSYPQGFLREEKMSSERLDKDLFFHPSSFILHP